jgi:hypothetical protein
MVCFIKVKYIKLNTISQENFFTPNYSPRRAQRTRRIIELKKLKDKDGREFDTNYYVFGSKYLQISGLVKKSFNIFNLWFLVLCSGLPSVVSGHLL